MNILQSFTATDEEVSFKSDKVQIKAQLNLEGTHNAISNGKFGLSIDKCKPCF